MRFAASPLLVAVAFGFLGPAALDAEDEDLDVDEMVDASSVSTSDELPAVPLRADDSAE
jgi:hypothetical protein